MEKSMKKATLIIWVIIFGFIALVIFQNQTFFLAKNSLNFNLGVLAPYQSPELPNWVLVLFFFFFGLIIAHLFSLSARFKARRTIKKLNIAVTTHDKELSELKREINTLKGVETPVDSQADTIKLDLNASQEITADAPGESSADKQSESATDTQTSNPSEMKEEDSSKKKK
jgi:uncharacterized integral membrane protein